jgi:CHAT domain-containing protein
VIPPATGKTQASTIMANPVFDSKENTVVAQNKTTSRSLRALNFSPLPGTKTESEWIKNTLQTHQQPVKLYMQAQASEARIKKEHSPRILHIATHGFFLENIKIPEDKVQIKGIQINAFGKMAIANIENPLARSGLAFSYANQGIQGKKQADGNDGILTALEVLDLNLAGTELVTLSACETGVGEISVGEGVYSLNRAFQEAGAKAVLSTLWSISDEGTNQFMQKFYSRFLSKKSAQQALQETQDEFKNSKEWSDPFYWAAFVMTGG